MSRPFCLTFYSRFVRTTVLFPRTALMSRLGPAEHLIGRSIDTTTGIGAILRPILQNLPSGIAGLPTALQKRFVDNLFDLITTGLLAGCDRAPLSAGMTLVRVKLWIETHLGEKLSAGDIASQFRLSVRHVNRLFNERDRR